MKPRDALILGLVVGAGVGVWIPRVAELLVRLLAGEAARGFGE